MQQLPLFMICMDCQRLKPPEDFVKDRGKPLGRRRRCKVCQAAIDVQRQRKNHSTPEQQRAWKAAHPDKTREYQQRWNAKHPEQRKEIQRQNAARRKAKQERWPEEEA
jgi:hypothetical protein